MPWILKPKTAGIKTEAASKADLQSVLDKLVDGLPPPKQPVQLELSPNKYEIEMEKYQKDTEQWQSIKQDLAAIADEIMRVHDNIRSMSTEMLNEYKRQETSRQWGEQRDFFDAIRYDMGERISDLSATAEFMEEYDQERAKAMQAHVAKIASFVEHLGEKVKATAADETSADTQERLTPEIKAEFDRLPPLIEHLRKMLPNKLSTTYEDPTSHDERHEELDTDTYLGNIRPYVASALSEVMDAMKEAKSTVAADVKNMIKKDLGAFIKNVNLELKGYAEEFYEDATLFTIKPLDDTLEQMTKKSIKAMLAYLYELMQKEELYYLHYELAMPILDTGEFLLKKPTTEGEPGKKI